MLRTVIGGAVAVAIAMVAPAAHSQTAPRATTAQGPVVGATDSGVFVFRGLPYAAPPVGERRWAPPAPPAAWGATPRDATKFGAACPQTLAPNGRPPWTVEYMHPVALGISEDCLTLNVWTPSRTPAAKLPVLVFLHGGGNVEGSGAIPTYDGVNLARKGVVVINLNYRLGPFGFLAHPGLTAEQGASGDYGVLDQIAALQWVKANIAAFGGDPAKVTISGQSAGASDVMALLVAPAAKGLFRAAIIQSSGGMLTNAPRTALAAAEQNGAAVLAKAGATTVAQARALTTQQVWDLQFRGGLVGDGKVLPAGPTVVNADVPLLVGFTLHDNATGGKRQVTAAAWKADVAARYGERAADFLKLYPGDTDAEATLSANREISERLYFEPLLAWRARATGAQPVYAYRFTHVEAGPESEKWGAFHTSEVPFVFNTLHLSPGRAFTPVDRKVAEDASSYWANFAKTGDPNGAGLPNWRAFTTANKTIMVMGDTFAAQPALTPAAAPLYAVGKPPSQRP